MIKVPVWLFDVFGDSGELRDIVELIKEFRTPVYMSAGAVYVLVNGGFVRVTWSVSSSAEWREYEDVKDDVMGRCEGGCDE